MRDSARVPEVSNAVSYDLRAVGAGYEVVLRADRDWLADATYPVAIDPTTSIDTNDDCYMVSGSDANAGFCGCTDPYIQIGKDGLNNIRRAFMRVDTSVESGTQRNIDLHRVTRQSTTARTWNKYDGTNAWTNAGGDYDGTPSGSESAYGGAVGTGELHSGEPLRVRGWESGKLRRPQRHAHPQYRLAVFQEVGGRPAQRGLLRDHASRERQQCECAIQGNTLVDPEGGRAVRSALLQLHQVPLHAASASWLVAAEPLSGRRLDIIAVLVFALSFGAFGTVVARDFLDLSEGWQNVVAAVSAAIGAVVALGVRHRERTGS